MQSIVVFSHLRWDFVFQRPQHLMTRLARSYNVFFFEEPVHDPGEPWLETSSPAAGVTVCRAHTPISDAGFADGQFPVSRMLLGRMLREQSIVAPVAWMYTPMALPMLEGLDTAAVVYDCMDELSAFLNAPRELLQREAALLKLADVVFTGGPSLFRSKRHLHGNVHCFPSSVQRDHFARARDASIDHDEQRAIPHPRLGFFGVIDERFDPASIALLADTHPEWQVVLVGPVVKIDAATLPRRPNIHYFGQRSYQELPAFLAGWDVCLLPFAMNESTRFISPTKVLEYMAAEKPIVSTPVTDVVAPYGHIVHIGADPESFVAACEQSLRESDEVRAKRLAQMQEVVNATSWEMTATTMAALIESAMQLRRKRRSAAAGAAEARRVVVIGAGPTGLSAAYHLAPGTSPGLAANDGAEGGDLLLEQQPTVGGWCRSVEDHGFTFDCAGHIMFSNDPYVHDLYGKLLGDNVHWQDR
ncbi:MAG TPA: NAD(P)-binding protein, partial [Steroidobacteraceae bacterium]